MKKLPYRIRQENLRNHPEYRSLYKLTFGNDGLMSYELQQIRKGKRTINKGWIARHSETNKILGWGILEHSPEEYRKNRFYIHVYVSVPYRNKGIGSSIVKKIRQHCNKKKQKPTIIVSGHSEQSQKFYRKNKMGRHLDFK